MYRRHLSDDWVSKASGARGRSDHPVRSDHEAPLTYAGPELSSRSHRLVPMCESCGAEDEDLTEVKRVYLTPESWDTEANSRVADDSEQWCAVCMVHYPHQVISQA